MGEEAGPDDEHALVAQRPEPLAQREEADRVVGGQRELKHRDVASGYMIRSGTHAPWSSPRLACWCTGSELGIIAATRSARAVAVGVS